MESPSSLVPPLQVESSGEGAFAAAALGGALSGLPSRSNLAAPVDRQSLLALIREQLEFYFSEDNLPKDVFLLKQIEKDKSKEGFVSLKVIGGFPKMKRLTHDMGAIREAVELSSQLILSVDGLSVKRAVPMILPEDTTEKRTLYVTRLPKDCDRESLMLVFSDYGTVVRLDLPMDKKNGEHKGMAFVEFQTEEQLRKALEDFTTNNKYSMVAKPFKSRNNNKDSPPVADKASDNTGGESDDDESELKDKKGKQINNSKEGDKRNSQEMKDSIAEKKRADDKRNSNKEKRGSKDDSEKRKSGGDKTGDREKRSSKDIRDFARPQQRTSKEAISSKRTSKDKELTGREVPQIPDSYDNSFNQSKARGAKPQRHSDKMREDDEDDRDIRPTSRPSSMERSKVRPQFIPVRSPYGPAPEARGFAMGRGKLIK